MVTHVLVNGNIVAVDDQFSVAEAAYAAVETIGARGDLTLCVCTTLGDSTNNTSTSGARALAELITAREPFRGNYLGSIALGLLTDMVVLDRDYLTVPEDEIRDIKPVATIVAGKVVYGGLPEGRRA